MKGSFDKARVTGRQCHQHVLVEESVELDSLVVRSPRANKGCVHLALQEPAAEGEGIGLSERQRNPRISLLKGADGRRDKGVERRREGKSDAELAELAPSGSLDVPDRLLGARQDPSGVFQERVAGICQLDPAQDEPLGQRGRNAAPRRPRQSSGDGEAPLRQLGTEAFLGGSVLGGFCSLIGRFNSLIGRLGNLARLQ